MIIENQYQSPFLLMKQLNMIITNLLNYSTGPIEAVILAFHIGHIISILCIIFSILKNTTLI